MPTTIGAGHADLVAAGIAASGRRRVMHQVVGHAAHVERVRVARHAAGPDHHRSRPRPRPRRAAARSGRRRAPGCGTTPCPARAGAPTRRGDRSPRHAASRTPGSTPRRRSDCHADAITSSPPAAPASSMAQRKAACPPNDPSVPTKMRIRCLTSLVNGLEIATPDRRRRRAACHAPRRSRPPRRRVSPARA